MFNRPTSTSVNPAEHSLLGLVAAGGHRRNASTRFSDRWMNSIYGGGNPCSSFIVTVMVLGISLRIIRAKVQYAVSTTQKAPKVWQLTQSQPRTIHRWAAISRPSPSHVGAGSGFPKPPPWFFVWRRARASQADIGRPRHAAARPIIGQLWGPLGTHFNIGDTGNRCWPCFMAVPWHFWQLRNTNPDGAVFVRPLVALFQSCCTRSIQLR